MTITEFLPYAQIGSTIFAAIGLYVNAGQYWRSRKGASLQQLQDFFKATNEREAALKTADDDDSMRHAFVEYLNFLEIYSGAENSRMFTGVASEVVREKLFDAIEILEGMPHWHEEAARSRTSKSTYKQLARFIVRNSRSLNAQHLLEAIQTPVVVIPESRTTTERPHGD